MYKLIKNLDGEIACILRDGKDSIPFDPANTDYQSFRTSILDGLAQLENADGVLMTSQEAIAFVETLPQGVTQ